MGGGRRGSEQASWAFTVLSSSPSSRNSPGQHSLGGFGFFLIHGLKSFLAPARQSVPYRVIAAVEKTEPWICSHRVQSLSPEDSGTRVAGEPLAWGGLPMRLCTVPTSNSAREELFKGDCRSHHRQDQGWGRCKGESPVMRHREEQQTWSLMGSINRRDGTANQRSGCRDERQTDRDGEGWPERTQGTRREAEGRRDLIKLMEMKVLQGRLSSLGGRSPDRCWPTAA